MISAAVSAFVFYIEKHMSSTCVLSVGTQTVNPPAQASPSAVPSVAMRKQCSLLEQSCILLLGSQVASLLGFSIFTGVQLTVPVSSSVFRKLNSFF